MSTQRLPPAKLMRRVGWNVGAARPEDVFAERGLLQWRLIAATLDQLGVKAGRGLDFGCGVGRILRAAVGTPTEYELWGCDIDGPSVAWLAADLGGRGHVFQSEEWPPLPIEDQSLDFAYAFSVFTHLVDSWSAWLSELHRVLRDDGILLATVAGPGRSEFAGELVSEDVMGMNVLYPSASWDTGGPLIIHSEWWLRAHWGRAFEIVELRPSACQLAHSSNAVEIWRPPPHTHRSGDSYGIAPIHCWVV
jgi:SAM-dependent methyltransferase